MEDNHKNSHRKLYSQMIKGLRSHNVKNSSIRGFMRHFRDAPKLYGSLENAERALNEYLGAFDRIPSKKIPEYLRAEISELDGLRNASPIGIRLRSFAYEDVDRQEVAKGRSHFPGKPYVNRCGEEMGPWQENAIKSLEGDW